MRRAHSTLEPGRDALRRLALQYGIQTAYYNVDGRRTPAHQDSLLAMLRALGAPIDGPNTIDSALRERRLSLWRRPLEPVIVAWEGQPAATELRVLAALEGASASCDLVAESGETASWRVPLSGLPTTARKTLEGQDFLSKRLALPEKLARGYHRLVVTIGSVSSEALVIAAPKTAHTRPQQRDWGLHVPLYALHSRESWGAGDFSDLERLAGFTSARGGEAIATLPLLAAFLDEPFEPSPYQPISRLFWNELFIDVARVPELSRTGEARAIVASPQFQDELSGARASPLVDYRSVMRLKRRVLEPLAHAIENMNAQRRDAFERYAGAHPALHDYASFRAAGERMKTPWSQWPLPARGGTLRPEDFDEDAHRYHRYVQWIAHEQLGSAASAARAQGVTFHLDFPLGAHSDGYDVWRESNLFIQGATVGAPPDTFQPEGQNWGSQPIDPAAQREQGYRYLIAALRHHLEFAGSLRIDHVMGLHRLYVIPTAAPNSAGVYLRYPADELYAIFCLESQRHRATLLGEDLGTVPRAVRAAMRKHKFRRSYVLELEPVDDGPPPVTRDTVASLSTHDLPSFCAFWTQQDLDERETLGVLPPVAAARERALRDAFVRAYTTRLRRQGSFADGSAAAVQRAALAGLSAGDAATVLVNLEDLWRETAPQNIPGTSHEYPNWGRKARYAIEDLDGLPEVTEQLKDVDRLRKRPP
ncbi:MAG: 4-alpha-glucanotransferase [Dehalococcoidia bacterium]